MKARIKSNGKIVEVISRFMPRKRNAASRDWVCNLSDGTCIDESQLEYIEESIDGLDEAAKEYEKRVIEETKCHHNALTYAEGYEDALLLIPGAFIDGAKWQKGQDLAEMAQSKSPLSVAYANRCFENGKQAMKEQMMKAAVDGMVCATITGTNAISFLSPLPDELNAGDKVKVIFTKEDEI